MGNETSTQEFLNCIHKDADLSLMHITAVKDKCIKDKVQDKNIILFAINVF